MTSSVRRLLTNHDMDSGSPFAVVLVGQPTLRHRLRLGVLAALDQRTAVRYTLPGMTPADTADYINHHTKIAGRSDVLFADDAITLIHNASRGHPRAVNNHALHALTAAFRPDTPSSGRKPHASPSAKQQQTESDSLQHDDHPVTATRTPSPRPPRPRSPHRAGPFSHLGHHHRS